MILCPCVTPNASPHAKLLSVFAFFLPYFSRVAAQNRSVPLVLLNALVSTCDFGKPFADGFWELGCSRPLDPPVPL